MTGGPGEDDPDRSGTAMAVAAPERHTPKHRPKKVEEQDDRGGFLGFFRELPGLVLIAFLLALLIKTFLVQAFYIPSGSMVPTLRIGDRVLVNKLVYDFGEPQRGDIVVFEDPHPPGGEPERNAFQAFLDWLTEGLGFSAGAQQDFIKRVIGLPGDRISMDNGQVFINDEPLEEPYLVRPGSDEYEAHVVEEGHLFVMGDNRPNSSDSRTTLGQIPYDKVVGKAFILLWPPSRAEFLSDD